MAVSKAARLLGTPVWDWLLYVDCLVRAYRPLLDRAAFFHFTDGEMNSNGGHGLVLGAAIGWVSLLKENVNS